MRPSSFERTFAWNTAMPNFAGPKQPSGDWELFLGMWERANSVRAYFWSQRTDDPKVLLNQFLARLRRYFAVDFCLGVLSLSEKTLVEVGVPESGMRQIPAEFSQRCLESIANSRAPVTWKEAGAGLGFRSTVVVPLRAPTDASFGFLMLGHSRSRSYTAVELFLLQALAAELSWVARDLAARNAQKLRLATASHAIKNGLQLILGHTALVRQKTTGSIGAEAEKYLAGVDATVEQIRERLRVLPDMEVDQAAPAQLDAEDISALVQQSLASSRQTARERGIDVEVICTPETPVRSPALPERVKDILSALVDEAALATRNETVRVTVRHRATDLELMVKGMGSNRVADKLKALFEDASRAEDARAEKGGDLAGVREYLEDTGGDAYLKSRPGEAAEFVVRLPIEGAAQSGRL